MTVQKIIACIDRSGSMHGKVKDTIIGINSAIKEIKDNKSRDDIINLSIKLFDEEEFILKDNINIENFQEINEEEFIPRGKTALLDTIGNTLKQTIEKKIENSDYYDCCSIYVATDGYENASTKYTKFIIRSMIENAKNNYKIEVIYLGANQDAILEAESLGINSDQAINYEENNEGIEAVYRSVARVVSSQRSNKDFSLSRFTQEERDLSLSQKVNEEDENPFSKIPDEVYMNSDVTPIDQINRIKKMSYNVHPPSFKNLRSRKRQLSETSEYIPLPPPPSRNCSTSSLNN